MCPVLLCALRASCFSIFSKPSLWKLQIVSVDTFLCFFAELVHIRLTDNNSIWFLFSTQSTLLVYFKYAFAQVCENIWPNKNKLSSKTLFCLNKMQPSKNNKEGNRMFLINDTLVLSITFISLYFILLNILTHT